MAFDDRVGKGLVKRAKQTTVRRRRIYSEVLVWDEAREYDRVAETQFIDQAAEGIGHITIGSPTMASL